MRQSERARALARQVCVCVFVCSNVVDDVIIVVATVACLPWMLLLVVDGVGFPSTELFCPPPEA